MGSHVELPARYTGSFYSMSQQGSFAIWETDPRDPAQRRDWVKSLASLEKTQFRATRELVCQLLEIPSYHPSEIASLLKDEEKIAQLRQSAYARVGGMYGIAGEPSEVRRRIDSYADIANSVIGLKNTIMEPYAPHLEMTNEVLSTSNPLDLVLLAVDEHFDKKLRFEAMRKLVLMDLAASVDKRESEIDTESKFTEFIRTLDDFVWTIDEEQGIKKGASTPTYLLSSHDPDTFACTHIQVYRNEIPPEPTHGQKITLLRRRAFTSGKHQVDVYVTERKKGIEDMVVKMLRKGTEDPAAGVDDNLGLVAVFDNERELERFYRQLPRSLAETGSLTAYEDIADTLHGEPYNGKNVGSSEELRMRKFFIKFKGMRVEIVLHTNETYLNERYQRGVAHEEYEIARLFDTGVAELLFPHEIYGLDMNAVRNDLIARARQRIEDPARLG